ncbi:MAG: COR domain-containing protein [Anaerolineales bacterium]|nr:MAG: COR domain-containing protein [Anaerolineales bacterium]
MYFDFEPEKIITIQSQDYKILGHPAVPTIAYGQEGRHAVVYQVSNNGNKYALKLYKSKFRSRNILERSLALQEYSNLPGLAACNQRIISRETDFDLIQRYPDFEYGILMPWIDAPTWFDILFQKKTLSIFDSKRIAWKFANIICSLEEHGIAHCDLSAPNVIVDTKTGDVSLVDFDNIFGSLLPEPISAPRGSEGYGHKSLRQRGDWSIYTDRFAAAILLIEMLTFHDDRIRYVAGEEHYFSDNDLQNQSTNRYRLVIQVLKEQGELYACQLLEQAWRSESLKECPSICEWVEALGRSVRTSIVTKRPSLEAKCILVGQGGVGKTSLLKQVICSIFDSNELKTEGISINHWQVDDKRVYQNSKINLNIWDFGGQEIMHTTHQFFLTKRSLYLLVLDSRLTQEENRVEYWLKIIQSFGGESPILIVGTKIDQHPLDIDRTGLQKKYPNIVGILETSAATGAGIEDLKATITEQVNQLPHVRDLLPETWFTVKTKLEELGKQSNFITHEKYLDLCTENGVGDEASQHTLIGFLHDLGVVLHFQNDPRLEALGILNPQWVTNGVYKILNSHTLFQNKGVLIGSMLNDILHTEDGYPRDKRLFIVDMMKKFDLCYDIDGSTFLVPDLLPKDEPYTGEWNGALAFKYAYGVLPSSIMSRFIVKMKDFVHQPSTWRSGTILKKDGNTAFVKADFEDKTVSIKVQGSSNTRRDTLSLIRGAFEMLHKSVAKLEVTQQVPHPKYPNLILDYEELIEFEREGVEEFPRKVDGKVIKVNVREMLNGIESENQRKEETVINHNYYGDINASGDFIGRDKNISAGDSSLVVGGNMHGNLISGNYNKINSAEIIPELKETLLQLGEAVNAMLQKLPADQAAEVAEDFGKLADEAVKPKPNKKWYSVSIEGLIKAAENLDKLGTPVISLSRKVLSLLMGGVVK